MNKSEEKYTYLFSESKLRQLRKSWKAQQIAFPIFLIVFFLLSPNKNENAVTNVIVILGILIFFEGILWIFSKVSEKKMKRLRLIISEDEIERVTIENDENGEKILIKEIEHVQFATVPSDEIVGIQIKTTVGTKISLSGFEKMAEIAAHLEESIIEKSKIKVHQLALDWTNPIWQIIFIFVLVLIVSLLTRLGESVFVVLYTLLGFTFALYLLISRPFTKSAGKRFRNVEVIAGVLTLIFVTLNILFHVVIQIGRSVR